MALSLPCILIVGTYLYIPLSNHYHYQITFFLFQLNLTVYSTLGATLQFPSIKPLSNKDVEYIAGFEAVYQ